MEKIDVFNHILKNKKYSRSFKKKGGYAWAPSNLALCKYWGKRNKKLNLPVTSSLSVSLGGKGTYTHIVQQSKKDHYTLNNKTIPQNTEFAKRLRNFLRLVRPKGAHYNIDIHTNIPIAAGLASSASGFASLIKALNDLYRWKLSNQELSILARLGSGSAARSLWEGFVEWKAGEWADGMDSHGYPLNYSWPELRIGIILISTQKKLISSTEAMQQTVKTSPKYKKWPDQNAQDLNKIKLALKTKNFELLGETTENNSVTMHTMMFYAHPPIIYSLPETAVAMQKVWKLRDNGLPVFFTQDAGPNLQILFEKKHTNEIIQNFPGIEIISPFKTTKPETLILVDEQNEEIGYGEKLYIHQQGKLHRAFSIFVIRQNAGNIEILLQQRSQNKYHSPNLWTNTCCGHPKPGEKTKSAAKKRLQEEMGFKINLIKIGDFKYKDKLLRSNLIEHEFDHVFIGMIDSNNQIDITPNPNEVQSYKWINLKSLKKDLNKNPHKYTAWLKPALKILSEYI